MTTHESGTPGDREHLLRPRSGVPRPSGAGEPDQKDAASDGVA